MSLSHYDELARLFTHPGPSFAADLATARALHAQEHPATAQALERFERQLPAGALALEELYTRTFDVQAITSLDIGYTLFGEDYKRGAVLANLNAEHRRAGVDCGTELADHLVNVLRLLPRLADLTLRAELVRVLLAPAVREMVREFEPARLAKKEELYKKHHQTLIDTAAGEARFAWRHALEAVWAALAKDFELPAERPVAGPSRFARAVGAELGLEDGGACGDKLVAQSGASVQRARSGDRP